MNEEIIMNASERISIRIEKDMKLLLEQLAERLQISSSELIRTLIENLINVQKLYDNLTLETVFSTNPLLTIEQFLDLPDEGKSIWNRWFEKEVDLTLNKESERDVH
ncbi:MAG: ribbon-helix-helix domain-containing protein [Promethearchaeota archaeon]